MLPQTKIFHCNYDVSYSSRAFATAATDFTMLTWKQLDSLDVKLIVRLVIFYELITQKV